MNEILDEAKALEYLYDALHDPIGISIEVDRQDAAKAVLYRVRNRYADLSCIQISNGRYEANELWLIRKTGKRSDAEEETDEDNPEEDLKFP